MEICKIIISKKILELLVDSGAISTDDFNVIGVDTPDYDYSSSEVWKALKVKSSKAYKDLKECEFNIRNK